MRRLLTCALFSVLVLALQTTPAADTKVDYREALSPLNDFIGQWKGDGKEKAKNFQEDIEWGWKFKGDEAWLVLKVAEGKLFKTGELHYIPDTKKFQLTVTDVNDKKLVFDGEYDAKKKSLLMEREDKDAKEMQQIRMFNAGDGVYLNYEFKKKANGRPSYTTAFEVKAKRDGVEFGPGVKKNECVVSGGLGTRAVTYKGNTYYICCSGCADAGGESDAAKEKYIKEFEAKKKK
jgi:hypothetical protein